MRFLISFSYTISGEWTSYLQPILLIEESHDVDLCRFVPNDSKLLRENQMACPFRFPDITKGKLPKEEQANGLLLRLTTSFLGQKRTRCYFTHKNKIVNNSTCRVQIK